MGFGMNSAPATPSIFHIEGFPDAVKVITVRGPLAAQLADLALHLADLHCAHECLLGINKVQEHFLREGLIVAALVRFYKCFGSSAARNTVRLDPTLLFGAHPNGLENYKFYKNVRDKHVAHDENSLSQAPIGAALNKREAPYKIAKVFSLAVNSGLVTQENFSNLTLLVDLAEKWVHAEIERISKDVTTELEAESYDALFARDELKISPVDLAAVGKNRK